VAHTGERRGAYRVFVGRNELKGQCVDERIILKGTFIRWDGDAWTGLVWLTIGRSGGRLQMW
jgi:hypothetical protein